MDKLNSNEGDQNTIHYYDLNDNTIDQTSEIVEIAVSQVGQPPDLQQVDQELSQSVQPSQGGAVQNSNAPVSEHIIVPPRSLGPGIAFIKQLFSKAPNKGYEELSKEVLKEAFASGGPQPKKLLKLVSDFSAVLGKFEVSNSKLAAASNYADTMWFAYHALLNQVSPSKLNKGGHRPPSAVNEAANDLINIICSKCDMRDGLVNSVVLGHALLSPTVIDKLTPEQSKQLFCAAMKSIVSDYFEVTKEMHAKLMGLALHASLNEKELVPFIEIALEAGQLSLAGSFINMANNNIPDINAVVEQITAERNIGIAQLVAQYSPDSIQLLLMRCVENNLETLYRDIVSINGHTLTPEEVARGCEMAFVNGNISLMKVLNPDEHMTIAVAMFSQLDEAKKTEKLLQHFLNSNTGDFQAFATLLLEHELISDEQHQEILQFVNNGGKLIARFPRPVEQQQMFEEYGRGHASYEGQQVDYGNRRLLLVNEVLKDLANGENLTLEEVYVRLRSVGLQKLWRNEAAFTPIGGRYAMFKGRALEKLQQARAATMPEVSNDSVGNQAKLSFIIEGTSMPLTSITSMRDLSFMHTPPPQQGRWLEQIGISQDWDTLRTMPLDTPENMAAFRQKAAEFYWKGVQLMPTDRGNAQTMLELHYLIYRYRGLEPPTPSREVVLPDCIALCSTLDEFVERYESCWEH